MRQKTGAGLNKKKQEAEPNAGTSCHVGPDFSPKEPVITLGFIRVQITLLCLSLWACTPAPFVEATVAQGSLSRHNGLWVVQLNGTPQQRGQALGQLIGDQLRWLLPRYMERIFGEDGQMDHQQLELVKALETTIPIHHQQQLRELARTAGVDYYNMLSVNLAPEVMAPLLCSCFAVNGPRSHNAVMRVGRNLDWFGGDILKHHALVVIETGENQQPFASVTWPGLVGVVTGINRAGLVATNLVVLQQRRDAVAGIPVLFAMRHMLESFSSPQQAGGWLRQAARTVPQNFLLASPEMAVVFETAPSRFRQRGLVSHYAAVGNLYNEDQKSHPRGRYQKMVKAITAHPMDTAGMQKVLHSVSMGDLNVQSAVLQPQTRTVDVATQRRPATRGPWFHLDLSPWLSPKP